MKRLLPILVTALVVFGMTLAERAFVRGVRRSMLKRAIGDLRILAGAIENYRCLHGTYPGSLGVDTFGSQDPASAIIRSETESIAYFTIPSFTSYTLLFRYAGGASFSGFELRDGRWVSWPDVFSADDLAYTEQAILSARNCRP